MRWVICTCLSLRLPAGPFAQEEITTAPTTTVTIVPQYQDRYVELLVPLIYPPKHWISGYDVTGMRYDLYISKCY